MSTSLATIIAVLAVFAGYTLLAPIVANLGRFWGSTWLMCPEHREYGRVRLNAVGAALTAGYGGPDLAVRRCSLRKPGEACDERCLHGADF